VLDALSPQRRRLVFGAGAIAVLLVMTLAVIGIVRVTTSVEPVPQNDPGPVLLVPGYGGNVQSLEPLAAALRSNLKKK